MKGTLIEIKYNLQGINSMKPRIKAVIYNIRKQKTTNQNSKKKKRIKKKKMRAPAGMAQWIECWPVNQRLTGSIPSQGTYLGCGPGPQ